MKLISKNLLKYYSHRKVVDNVSIELEQGQIIGLLGPNGAGKTTTFHMITGLVKPACGQIFLGDEEITSWPMYKRARKGIGYLSQEPSIFQGLTVEKNLSVILELKKISQDEKETKKRQLLKEFGVWELRKQKASTLSGGEKRRTEIARLLVNNPYFILLDEPFSGIDPLTVIDLQKIIKNLKNNGVGILITDHNVRETLEIVDFAYIIHSGKILISGTAQELINSKEAQKLYLGEDFKI